MAVSARMAGAGYLGQYSLTSAFVFEAVATCIFLICILGVTQRGAPSQFAGLAIGLTLTAIHIVGINVTGVSVNPARSIGPALIGYGSAPHAVAQLWLFIVAPLIGAGVAGLLFKSGAAGEGQGLTTQGGWINEGTSGNTSRVPCGFGMPDCHISSG